MYHAFFITFITTNKYTIIKVHITTVSFCNLHSYMFRYLGVIIREFSTNVLQIYLRSSNCIF